MMRTTFGLLCLVVLGCGARQGGTGVVVEDDFDCRDRRAGFELTGGFGAHKVGVAVRCSDGGPQLVKFRQETPDAERKLETHAIGSATFDKLWEKIDSTGWRHIGDCEYIGLDDDPQYLITVGDQDVEVKVSCAGKKLQFPHDQIVNELELEAAGLGTSN